MDKVENQKLIVILGPTACGKTKIAVRLASKYQGEIISADSRQVYRGMDIGTGKDLKYYQIGRKKIPYHLIDVASPQTDFNVAKYQKLAYKSIADILHRDKIPFLVGGSGLYIDAVARGYVFSSLTKKTQNSKLKTQNLRKKFNKLSLKQLLSQLKKVDPKTYQIIDKKNTRRVQRALEIYFTTGLPKSQQLEFKKPAYNILFLGVKFPLEKIYQKIDRRLESRLQEGMISEVKKLKKGGVSWKRLEGFGLEYRYLSRYLRGEINYSEMTSQLKNAIHHFAKRQLTWFKRNKDIIWVDNLKNADQVVKNFLN